MANRYESVHTEEGDTITVRVVTNSIGYSRGYVTIKLGHPKQSGDTSIYPHSVEWLRTLGTECLRAAAELEAFRAAKDKPLMTLDQALADPKACVDGMVETGPVLHHSPELAAMQATAQARLEAENL